MLMCLESTPRHTLRDGRMLQRPAEMQEQYFSVNCGILADRHMQVIMLPVTVIVNGYLP